MKRNTRVCIAGAVAAAVFVSGCGGSNLRTYTNPSGAMLPTLRIGSTFSVDVTRHRPGIGDIIVFHPPGGADSADAICGDPHQGTGHSQACDQPTPTESVQTFVKRVVAGPGDAISIVAGRVIRNGIRELDSYTNPCGGGPDCTFSTTITIPPGDYFVLGDNRGASDDSRFWGPVPAAWIVGVVER